MTITAIDPVFQHSTDKTLCQTEATWNMGGSTQYCDAHDRRVEQAEYVTYRLPENTGTMRCRVIGRAVRNGIPKVNIIVSEKRGWDLWVPESRVAA